MGTKRRLLISVKEAQKLLGQKSKSLTKEELETLIIDGEQLARFTMHEYLVRKSEVVE